MTGFTFYTSGKDVFVNTNRKKKTDVLAREIIDRLNHIDWNIPNTPEMRKQLLGLLQRAKCEIKTLSDGRSYFEISGDNFGGKGSWLGDGKTLILSI